MHRQPIVQLTLSSTILGLGAVLVVFIDLSAVAIAFYRLFIGAIIFASILLLRRQSLHIDAKTGLFASLAGIFFAFDLSLWNASILSVGPGIATILNSLQVFFMAAFAMLLYKEKANGRFLLSLFVTFIGVVLLSRQEINTQEQGLYGIIAGVLSAVAFAASMVCLRVAALQSKDGLVKMMFFASVAGSLTTAIWIALADDGFTIKTSQDMVMMLAYAIFVHVIAWFLMAKSMPKVSVALVGLVFCLEPVVAFVVDIGFLEKNVTSIQVIGATLTLSAIYLGSQFSKNTA